MEVLYYTYFRLVGRYGDKEPNAYLPNAIPYMQMCALLMINAASIFFFINGFFRLALLKVLFSYNIEERRLFIIPLLILPIYISVYIFYRINQNKIENKLQHYAQIDDQEKIKYNRRFRLYVIATIGLFFLSISSGGVLRLFNYYNQ